MDCESEFENGYLCDDGVCINETRACDGVMNCADGSDEKNCSKCDTYTLGKYSVSILPS